MGMNANAQQQSLKMPQMQSSLYRVGGGCSGPNNMLSSDDADTCGDKYHHHGGGYSNHDEKATMMIDTSIPTIKVTNQWIVDPYGDKGQYDGDLTQPEKNENDDDDDENNNTAKTSIYSNKNVENEGNLPHGYGIMRYTDGRTYEGTWNQGHWYGRGRATFSNGDSYEGEYGKFDQRHGEGVYQWTDGRFYRGSFRNDQRSGKGQYFWPDGAIYEGDFLRGLRHGIGTYRFRDGSFYSGSWSEGKFHGQGEMRWADGRVYVGQFKGGRAHGYGVETRPNGTIRHDGEWRHDKPVRDTNSEAISSVETVDDNR